MNGHSVNAELIQSYLAQLRPSVASRSPVEQHQLHKLYRERDYPGLVRLVRDSMKLQCRLQVGLVNNGGSEKAVAWVPIPKPMPRFGSAEFNATLFTVYLRKAFLANSNFEQVVSVIAHELSHILLSGIGHPLAECEEAVDLTAMLLGYRDFFVAGSQYVEVSHPTFWRRFWTYFKSGI